MEMGGSGGGTTLMTRNLRTCVCVITSGCKWGVELKLVEHNFVMRKVSTLVTSW